MKRIIIFPYKFGSATAKILARALPAVRVRDNGRYRKRNGDFIVNWGSTMLPTWGEVDLNKPQAVANAVNKATALQIMKDAGVRTVEFTSDSDIVRKWIQNADTVYARTLTRASEGRGISLLTANAGRTTLENIVIPHAPLYTKGINSPNEYRIHVFNGQVIDYTKKVPLSDSGANANSLIKSHGNGWTFARNIERRPSIEAEAVKAVQALGLDFGAVDIICNPADKDRPYVLEVNTACGMCEDGRTLSSYSNAIKNFIAEQ